MYLYYCYRDWYDYLYTNGYLITYLKLQTLFFYTIIGSSVQALTSLWHVSVSDRIIDCIDKI